MFKCLKCYKSFTSHYNLNTHLNKKTPCVSGDNNANAIVCEFCNNSFSTQSSLNRHLERCIVRKNPELLLKHIEKQKELLNQKDTIIEQKDELLQQKDTIIEQLKDTQNVDNSIETNNIVETNHGIVNNNVDNSTNITNNFTLIEQPLALRSADMLYLLKHYEENNESEFWVLARNIRESMKKGDLDGMINSLLTYIHNNKKLKEGQNLRYCPDGKHKGELLIYDYDEKGIGFWRPSDVRPVSLTLSTEFKRINKIQDEKNDKNKDDRTTKERNTKKEEYNIGQLGFKSEHIHEDLAVQECVIKFIKKFRISKIVPENIRDNVLEEDHPLNGLNSPAVKRHQKKIRAERKL